MRTLNRELGVSHNLLHQRFGSKDALWYAAVEWGFGGLVDELTRADDEHAEPLERFRAFVRTFVHFSARYPDLHRLVNGEAAVAGERLDHLCVEYVEPVLARVVPYYAELVASGRIRDVPPPTLYYLITSGGAALYSSEALTRRLFSPDAIESVRVGAHADAVADILCDGLLVRNGNEM